LAFLKKGLKREGFDPEEYSFFPMANSIQKEFGIYLFEVGLVEFLFILNRHKEILESLLVEIKGKCSPKLQLVFLNSYEFF
jgi:hypothetical protein